MVKFYDTCSLIDLQDQVYNEGRFFVSNITLNELEQIKTSATRDEEIKWKARKVLQLLHKNRIKYDIAIYNKDAEEIIDDYRLVPGNDSRIIATAYMTDRVEEITFVTSDLACQVVADSIGLKTELVSDYSEDKYTGYKEVKLSDEELANFYNNILQDRENTYELLTNQYLLIRDKDNHIVDKYRWNGNKYEAIGFLKAESKMFGKVTPKDDYQLLALDTLYNNKISMLRGPAGTGKSYLAFGYMFSLLEQGKIDKIIIFCNTVATKGSAKLT